MDDALDVVPTLPEQPPAPLGEPMLPTEPVAPIRSRFLFVDVAALRAKQLRRGARLRYEIDPGLPAPKKPERQAMEEVKRCLVQYTVPPWKGVGKSDPADDVQ